MPTSRQKSWIEQLHTTHEELELPEKAAAPPQPRSAIKKLHTMHEGLEMPKKASRPPPPPMETRPDHVRRSIHVDEIERLRSMIAYGESQRQRILVDHMKLLSEYNILKKQSSENCSTDDLKQTIQYLQNTLSEQNMTAATTKALQERNFIFDYAKVMEEKFHRERVSKQLSTLELHSRYHRRLALQVGRLRKEEN